MVTMREGVKTSQPAIRVSRRDRRILLGTEPGEEYTKGIVTGGADNVLRIKVVVT